MAVPLSDYVEIKNNYCLAYLGEDQHTLDEIIRCHSELEALYPGIHIYICGNDKLICRPHAIPLSELDRTKFAYIREIKEIREILQESGLDA